MGLLDEAMHDADTAILDEEHEPSDAPTWQRRTDFPQPTAEKSTKRHADRPAKLHRGEIRADCAAVVRGQAAKPVEHRFRAADRAVEIRGDFRQARVRHSDPFEHRVS